jgi:hypothetical protein
MGEVERSRQTRRDQIVLELFDFGVDLNIRLKLSVTNVYCNRTK